jgi:hypothetical protein
VQVFKIYRKLREGVAYIPGGPIVASVELMFPPPPSTYVLWERGANRASCHTVISAVNPICKRVSPGDATSPATCRFRFLHLLMVHDELCGGD